jgi:EAL domain-containing protein (putative c-di-GMP-specific phosphodiesterase class I)
VGHALKPLSTQGLKIALDDFGSGYGSIPHLKQLPVNIVKIDKSFIATLKGNSDDAATLRAILDLAMRLGLTTVAEGG